MSAENEYRRQAEYCEKMSRRADTLESRVAWLRLASKWLALIAPAQPNPLRGSDSGAWSPTPGKKLRFDH
jgi:hypothetical protein